MQSWNFVARLKIRWNRSREIINMTKIFHPHHNIPIEVICQWIICKTVFSPMAHSTGALSHRSLDAILHWGVAWHLVWQHVRSNKSVKRFNEIQQDSKWLYKIQQDSTIFNKIQQDSTRFNEIQRDLTRFKMIVQDSTRFNDIQRDSTRFNKIQIF